MTSDTAALIRALNDRLREHGSGGLINATIGVDSRGPIFVAQALKQMAENASFNQDNDPYGEHDFGSLEIDGTKLFWKIDYYDPTLSRGADDPSDPAQCARVLTIMLAEEY